MDPQRRARYLQALEITPWTRKSATGGAVEEAPSQQPAALPARPVAEIETKMAKREERAAMPAATVTAEVVAPARREIPADWEGLRQAVAGCTACKLCKTRTQTVFGVGHAEAPLMVIGEGPGETEDQQGEPFVGRAGKLLDEMLRAIGRNRKAQAPEQAVFIANVVKCRPPGNRDPEAEEVEACRPYLDRQIALVKPKLIVALGRIAAQRLLSTDVALSKLRGQLHAYGPERTAVLVTYHPAYLLRSPGEKAKSWADLKRAHRFLGETKQA